MYKVCFIILFVGILPHLKAQYLKNKATDEYIGFYQQVLSNQKNSRCAMFPSCSNYGKMVLRDKPFMEAITLLTDRIIRCSHERELYDVTYQYGYRSAIDYPYYMPPPIDIVHNRKTLPHTDNLKIANSGDSILPFINYLINREYYQNAIIEIERVLFNKRNSNPILFSQKLLCYRAINELERGIFEYETEFPDLVKGEDKVNIQAALLYYSTSNYGDALSILDKVIQKNSQVNEWQKSYLLKGIIKAHQREFQEAMEIFRQALFLKYDKERYYKNLSVLKKMQEQKKKSPFIAKLLSVIPGGGYLYANHKGSALTAFIINSLLGYATYTSIKSKNYGVAGVCGFLGLSFYIGNINGAGRSAVRYNERIYKMYIQELENNNHIFIN